MGDGLVLVPVVCVQPFCIDCVCLVRSSVDFTSWSFCRLLHLLSLSLLDILTFFPDCDSDSDLLIFTYCSDSRLQTHHAVLRTVRQMPLEGSMYCLSALRCFAQKGSE